MTLANKIAVTVAVVVIFGPLLCALSHEVRRWWRK
jgi:hypothetical protein